MGISDKIIGNILGKPRVRGGKKDWDGDGIPNKKDCQPRNTMRQDIIKRWFPLEGNGLEIAEQNLRKKYKIVVVNPGLQSVRNGVVGANVEFLVGDEY